MMATRTTPQHRLELALEHIERATEQVDGQRSQQLYEAATIVAEVLEDIEAPREP